MTTNLKVGEHVRQGDVLLIRRGRIPARLSPIAREKGGVVLAHGEVTGHAHMLRGPQVAMFRDDRGHAFVRVADAPDRLVHEEHTSHTITPGDFELAVQVEYEPAELRVTQD